MGRGVHSIWCMCSVFVLIYTYVVFVLRRLLRVHGRCILRKRIVCMFYAYGTYMIYASSFVFAPVCIAIRVC